MCTANIWSGVVAGSKSPGVSTSPATCAMSNVSYALLAGSSNNSITSTLSPSTSSSRTSRLSAPTIIPFASHTNVNVRVDNSLTSSTASGRGFEVRFSAPVFDEDEDIVITRERAMSQSSDSTRSYADICRSPRDSQAQQGQAAYSEQQQQCNAANMHHTDYQHNAAKMRHTDYQNNAAANMSHTDYQNNAAANVRHTDYQHKTANMRYTDNYSYQRSASDGRYAQSTQSTAYTNYRRVHSDGVHIASRNRGRGDGSRGWSESRGGSSRGWGEGRGHNRGNRGYGGGRGRDDYYDQRQHPEQAAYSSARNSTADSKNNTNNVNGQQGPYRR